MATENEKKILIEVELKYGATLKELGDMRKRVSELKDEQKTLDRSTKDGRTQYEALGTQIRKTNSDIRTMQKEVDKEIATERQHNTSLIALREQLSKLTLQYAKLSSEQRKSADGKALQLNIKNLSNEIKGIEGTLGNFTRNVGNYPKVLGGLKPAFLGWAGAIMAVGSALKSAGATTIEFERQMAKVKAITGATAVEMEQLTNIATEYATKSGFTASQVAGLELELGKLGYTTQQIIDATGAITLTATATGEGLERTAEIVGSTTTMFGLSAKETERVSDVIGKALNISALGLESFGESIKYVGPIAKQAGISLEETSALLGVLANNGIKGSQAGTSLRQIMSELIGTGGSLQERLQQLADKGINLKDANDEVGKSAKTSLLVLKDNVAILPELTEGYRNATGEISKAAGIMQDNVSGQWERIKSGFLSAILTISDTKVVKSAFRWFADRVEEGVNNLKFMQKSENERYISGIESISKKRLETLLKYEKELKKKSAEQGLKIDKDAFINAELQKTRLELKAFNDKIKKAKEENERIKNLGGGWEEAVLANQKNINALQTQANVRAQLINDLKNERDSRNEVVKVVSKDTEETTKNTKAKKENNDKKNEAEKQKEKIIAVIKSIGVALSKSAEDTQKELEDQVQDRLKAEAKVLQKSKNNLATKLESEQQANDKKFLKGEQSAEDYEKNKVAIAEKYRVLEYNAELNAIENQIAINGLDVEAKEALEQKKFDLTQQYAEKSSEILIDQRKNDLEKEKEYNDKLKELKSQLFEQFMSSAQDITAGYFERQNMALDEQEAKANEQYQRDIERAGNNDKKKAQIEAQQKVRLDAIDKEKRKKAREQAIAEKAFAVLSIALSTAKAIMGALAPPPSGLGPVAGIPLGVVIGATGALQLASVLAQPLPKASRGILLKGKSHAQGGIPIEAEGGEAIINKRSTAMYKPLLSALNVAGGGVKFATGGIPDGGYLARQNSSISMGITKTEMQEVISQMKIYTAVEDIRKGDANYTKIEDRATY